MQSHEFTEVVQQCVPEWATGCAAGDFTLTRFTEATTNSVWRCCGPRGITAMVRVYGKKSEVMIDRTTELTVTRFLGECDIVPRIFGKFTNGVVSGYAPGAALSAVDLATHCERIAKHMARMHKLDISAYLGKPRSHIWKLMKRWLAEVPATLNTAVQAMPALHNLNMYQIPLEVEFITETLNRPDLYPVVLCHNDVQPLNIIFDANSGQITFVDMEYSFYNHFEFDIANHFCEYGGLTRSGAHPSEEMQRKFISHYLTEMTGVPPTEKEVEVTRKDVLKFELVSDLLWGIWGLAEAKLGADEVTHFGYVDYTVKRFIEYDTRKRAAFPDQRSAPLYRMHEA
eukprot:TRINITY_DN5346_c0_g1_i1.p1 TRINITY_DN5346_c0_g1~~TRINITY_DN5346_c0_g1_i1.p1  ORF type:complete len:365 (-),score=83.07 TRINITY_DN5346_c0_g1_i1:36-1061(-)